MEQNNTDHPRVLLVGYPDLLIQGLYDIFGHDHHIETLGPFAVSDQVLANVKTLRADVVVVSGENSPNMILIANLLRAFPRLPVISVGLDENSVTIHRSERLAATSANLLNAIRHLAADTGSDDCSPVLRARSASAAQTQGSSS